jgi:hypothetical protein
MRRALTAGLVAAIAALGAACGSDEDPQADAVAEAYTTYIEAVKAGDGETACGLLTPARRREAAASVAVGNRAKLKGLSCEEAVSQGTLPQIQQVEPNLEDVEVNGNRASGLDPGEGLIGPQEVHFRRLGGQWKISKTVFYRRGPPQ